MAGTGVHAAAAWVGVGGLTLCVVLLASSVSLGSRGWAAGAGGGGDLGRYRRDAAAPPALAPPGLNAVLVQGNVSEIEHRDHYQDQAWVRRIFDRHLDLTRQGVARAQALANGNRTIVVWPETASPYWLQQDDAARQ